MARHGSYGSKDFGLPNKDILKGVGCLAVTAHNLVQVFELKFTITKASTWTPLRNVGVLDGAI